jgi:hypothetical protein
MGYGSYHDNVESAREAMRNTRAVSAEMFSRGGEGASAGKQGIHGMLDIRRPNGRQVVSSEQHPHPTPLALFMDVTSSRGPDALALYQAVPALLGSLQSLDLVSSPQIAWIGVGDAKSDVAGLQFSPFESDARIDQWLQELWLEGGGGGTGEESYELAAYAVGHRIDYCIEAQGRKGYAFIFGDEAPYPAVSAYEARSVLGVDLQEDVPTEEAFRRLQQLFHVFLIQPRATAAERRQAIDSEMQKRLEAEGGQFREVDIRFTMRWDNLNLQGGDYWDLDLHANTPAGRHIYYGDKHAECGGFLDVDANAERLMEKPVENIRWASGKARPGEYEFWVVPYSRHGQTAHAVEFYYELEINGEIVRSGTHTFKANARGEANRFYLGKFRFAKGERKTGDDAFAAYDDRVVRDKWRRYLPASNILQVQDAASGVEALLGAIALQEGKMTLDEFMAVLEEREVPQARRDDVRTALAEFARHGVVASAPAGLFS